MSQENKNTQATTCMKICSGHACSKNFSQYILERAESEAKKIPGKISVESCGCQGNCEKGPTIVLEKNGKKEIIPHATPIKAAEIIKKI